MPFGRINSYERGQFKRRNYFKLEEGESIYRILPPYGSLQDTNRYSYYWRVHFGFAGTDGKMKPFACIQSKDGNGMTTQRCPVCEMQTQLQIRVKQVEDSFHKELAAAEAREPLAPAERNARLLELERVVKPLKDRIRAVDPDAKHYMNVMTMDGQLGVLKIPNKSMVQLRNRITKLQEEGKDPINPEAGVFFIFRRHGTGNQTDHQVDVYKEKVNVNGEMLERTKPAPLTDEVLKRCDGPGSEVFELSDMYKRLSEAELDMLAKGDATVVDRLFARPEKGSGARAPAPAVPPPVTAQQTPAPAEPTVPQAQVPAPAPVSIPPATVAPTVGDPPPSPSSTGDGGALPRQSVTAPVPRASGLVTTNSAPPTTARNVDVASMSDEDFERMFQESISK